MEKKFFKNKNTGFTLVEVLVAVAIFSVSILGIMSVLTSSLSDTIYAKNKMTAEYLAQEGIEYIRNMRDTYVLYDTAGTTDGWNNFNTKVAGTSGNTICATTKGCYFDDSSVWSNFPTPGTKYMENLTLNACSQSCPTLLYDNTPSDSNYGKYGYSPAISGVNSGFIRKITVTPSYSGYPYETQITSTVYYTQGSGTYNISFSEVLYNWVQ